MNPRNLTLTKSNAKEVAKYASLVGQTPAEFLNRFLAEFLVNRFGDKETGNAEPFLLSFTFKDREVAERLAAWVRERLTFPNSRDATEVEIFEVEGGYRIRAAWIAAANHSFIRD